MQFKSPAANIVGFEYQASSADEIEIAKNALSTLQTPNSLFKLVHANCDVIESNVDMSQVFTHSSHEHHASQAHHTNHEHHEHHESHTEVSADYHFMCRDSQMPQAIKTSLPQEFPSIEKLTVMWVTGSHQGAEMLTPSETSFDLKY